ncbi:MAG: hypothetical protein ACYSSI_05255 [Planctomycetota bacterium]|jgi:hypothetical protein
MNNTQKRAWFELIVVITCLFMAAGTVAVLTFKMGFKDALGGFGLLGFCAVNILSPFIFRKKKGAINQDERDILIQKNAGFAGFGASYVFFVCFCIITWIAVGIDGKIPVNILPFTVVLGYIIACLVNSITTLVQYGRRNKK